MKVLFLSSVVWNAAYRGRYYHFFRHLVAHGHSVVVLAPRPSPSSDPEGDGDPRPIRPVRVLDSWVGAVEVAQTFAPDVVVASSPPRLLSSLTSHAWLSRRRSAVTQSRSGKTQKPGAFAVHRPFLVFDYSDEGYLADLEACLGHAGYLGQTLRRKALACLASRSDLVIAASEALRRELSSEALVLTNPPGAQRRPSLVSAETLDGQPSAPASLRLAHHHASRCLAVAVLGPFDSATLAAILTLATTRPDLDFTLLAPTASPLTSGLAPAVRWPPNVKAATSSTNGRLASRLGHADVAVLLPAAAGCAGGLSAPQDADRSDHADRLLAALTAGCPVLAAAGIKGALGPPIHAADLNSSDLAFFASMEDLGEMLLRFSLTADPGRSRSLKGKADRLRWAPAVEGFERALTSLLDPARSGLARG